MPGARCHTRSVPEYADAVVVEIERLADLVEGAGLSTPVPTCGDWTLLDLVDHIGAIHRWAAQMVRELSPTRLPREQMDLGQPSTPAGWVPWLRGGAAPLREAFLAADPEAAMWVWGLDQHVRFWPRRMLHETTVHRADAALAVGAPAPIEPAVAVDGIDELLDNLPPAAYFAPRVAELVGDGEVLRFEATDAATSWRVELQPDGYRWDHDEGSADVVVRGAAADLLLGLYGRPTATPLRIEGDRAIYERWIERSAL